MSGNISTKLEHTGKNGTQRVKEAYDVAAVNLIFGKFVEKRKDNKVYVENKINKKNKNSLFLLAIQVYDTNNFKKWCKTHQEGWNIIEADEMTKYKKIVSDGKDVIKAMKLDGFSEDDYRHYFENITQLELNNTSDCIGVSEERWYLTRNNAADSTSLGTQDPLTPSRLLGVLKVDVFKKQYALYEAFKKGKDAKIKSMKTILDMGKDIYPEGLRSKNGETIKFNEELPLFKSLKKIYSEVVRQFTSRFTTGPHTIALYQKTVGLEFVKNAQNYNFELTKFIHFLQGIKKSSSLPIQFKEKKKKILRAAKKHIEGSLETREQSKRVRQQLQRLGLIKFEDENVKEEHKMMVSQMKQNLEKQASGTPSMLRSTSDPRKNPIREGVAPPVAPRLLRTISHGSKYTSRMKKQNLVDGDMKKLFFVERILEQLRNEYIDFYVKRTSCKPGVTREIVDKQLYTAITTKQSDPDFATIVTNCKVIFGDWRCRWVLPDPL